MTNEQFDISERRFLLHASGNMYGCEVKTYKRVWITNPNLKTRADWPSIPVNKIESRHIIKRVYINDHTQVRTLHFIDGTEKEVSEKEFLKMMFKHHRENRRLISLRNFNIEAFVNKKCLC